MFSTRTSRNKPFGAKEESGACISYLLKTSFSAVRFSIIRKFSGLHQSFSSNLVFDCALSMPLSTLAVLPVLGLCWWSCVFDEHEGTAERNREFLAHLKSKLCWCRGKVFNSGKHFPQDLMNPEFQAPPDGMGLRSCSFARTF